MNRFALVVFDCDGVLVDSELITNRIFASMLNDLGVAAGVAAGMTVYGYRARTPRYRLQQAGARYTFDDMSQLPLLLATAP
jgi:beta-phosphoglucomutase-like phosphatase (HAD superfamily)